MNITTTSKKDLISQMLDKGTIQVHVDARHPGVLLPPHLMNSSQVPLNLSHKFKYSVRLFEEGIYTCLTFHGQPYNCILPWDSIWHVRADETSYLFDVPREFGGYKDELPVKPKVIVDHLDKLKLVVDNEQPLFSPPRRGHLRLLN